MTIQADDSGRHKPGARLVRKAGMLAGHYSLWLLLLFGCAALANDAAGQPGITQDATHAALILGAISYWADTLWHQYQLCARCAAATPLDPQKTIDRWHRFLRADHSSRLISAALLSAAAWAILVVQFVVTGTGGLPEHHAPWAYILADLPSLIVITAYYVIRRKHRRLRPWCPWCAGWGNDPGGDDEDAPAPAPEDHGVRA